MKEIISKYQCPKCKVNLDFGYTMADVIHDEAKHRYNLDRSKGWRVSRCPKCFREYAV